MRAFVAAILITILIFNLSCATLHENIKKEKILFKCDATYKTGNLTIKAGKKGKMFLLEKQIWFASKSGKEIYEKIPYDKIKSFRYEEEIKNILFKRGNPLYRYVTRGSMFPSFWESLRDSLLLIAAIVIGYFLIKSMKDYVFVRFEIENNADVKWAVFKIEEESFFKVKKILEERCGLESLK